MFGKLQPDGKRFAPGNHVDAAFSFVLLLVSLTFYSLHWLMLPPPRAINVDAVRLGMYAHDLLQEGVFPFYVFHQLAPNPLSVYIQAPVFAAFGYNIASIQGITVVAGALASPAIYWAARWFFEDQGTVFARRAGLIAAVGLALSTSFASLSRYGTEQPLLAVVVAAAVAFLWRGFRRGRKLDFVLAGLSVGVSQYVYISARFFPVALAAAGVGAVLANRQLLAHWRGLIWAIASAALVALPQWVLFVTFPYTFSARVSNPYEPTGGQFVFELEDPIAVVAVKLASQLSAVCCYWSNFYGSLALESLLTPILVVGLIAGIVAVTWKRREGYLFCLVMMVVTLLPELLTYEEFDHSVVNPGRLILAFPFIFLMAGMGTATIWRWIEGRRRLPHWIGYLVVTLVLLSGLQRQWDFATRIGPQFHALDGHRFEFSQIADYIGEHPDRPVLLPTYQYQYRHTPLAFLLADQFPQRKAGGAEMLQQGEEVTVIQLDLDNPFREDWVMLRDGTAHFLPPMIRSIEPLDGERTAIVGGNGVLVAEAFAARWQGEAASFTPVEAVFENHLKLVGYQTSELQPGSPLRVTFYWQPGQRIERDVELIGQLYDRNRDEVVALIHDWPLNGVYRVRAWQPGQTMPLSYSLPIPGDLPPGPYQLNVGVFDLIARERIPLVSGQDVHLVKTFKVSLPEDDRVPEISTEINFGDVIELGGYTLTPVGDGLKVTLFWRAAAPSEHDYTAFVHVVDADDQIVAQVDMQPLGGRYPTSIWSPGESIVEERTISPIPNGVYRIFVGWYLHHDDGWERLSVVSEGSSSAPDRALLETINLP